MKTIKIKFFFTEIGVEKGKILIFHVIFLNNDISSTVADHSKMLYMYVSSSYPSRGKRVSDFLFRP